MTATNTQRKPTTPSPAPVEGERGTAGSGNGHGGGSGGVSALPVDLIGSHVTVRDGKRKGGFLTAIRSEDQARLDAKARLLTTASQRLAEARDMIGQSGEVAGEAQTILNDVGTALYQGLARKVLSLDDMNQLLGNQFGFRKKGDAKTAVPAGHKEASKTPFGDGEGIRKRVVRAFQAFDYVNNNNETAFFADMPEAKVRKVLSALPHPDDDGKWVAPTEGETLSIWRVYDVLSEIKRDNTADPVNPAFNFRRVAAMATELERDIPASIRLIRETPGLADAYAALMNTLNALDEATAEEEKKAA